MSQKSALAKANATAHAIADAVDLAAHQQRDDNIKQALDHVADAEAAAALAAANASRKSVDAALRDRVRHDAVQDRVAALIKDSIKRHTIPMAAASDTPLALLHFDADHVREEMRRIEAERAHWQSRWREEWERTRDAERRVARIEDELERTKADLASQALKTQKRGAESHRALRLELQERSALKAAQLEAESLRSERERLRQSCLEADDARAAAEAKLKKFIDEASSQGSGIVSTQFTDGGESVSEQLVRRLHTSEEKKAAYKKLAREQAARAAGLAEQVKELRHLLSTRGIDMSLNQPHDHEKMLPYSTVANAIVSPPLNDSQQYSRRSSLAATEKNSFAPTTSFAENDRSSLAASLQGGVSLPKSNESCLRSYRPPSAGMSTPLGSSRSSPLTMMLPTQVSKLDVQQPPPAVMIGNGDFFSIV